MKPRLSWGLVFLIMLGLPPARGAVVLVHNYELNGAVSDSEGGPDMVLPTPAGLGASGYTFTAGNGPRVSGAVDPSAYSIEMYFRIDNVTSWVKLIDFKNLASDNGLYNYFGKLQFYPYSTGSVGAITAGCMRHVVITRDDATKRFKAYLNGVRQIELADSLDDAVFDATGNVMYFFVDDVATGGGEAAGGFLDFVKIYDDTLSAGQISTLTVNAGAEPGPSITGNIALCAADTLSLTATSGFASYQWYKSGAEIVGATSSTYTKANVVAGDAGTYSVKVTGLSSCPLASELMTVTVNSAPVKPNVNGTYNVCSGGTIALSAPSGYGSYQWNLNGAPIPGATSLNYTQSAAAVADAGDYTVTVGNACGSASTASDNFALTVNSEADPSTPSLSGSSVVVLGSPLTLTAGGGTYAGYQWNKNGFGLSGATVATYTKGAVALSDAGDYSVTVANASGCQATSATLSLNVTPLSLSTNSLSFGTQAVMIPSTAQTVTVSNLGSVPLTITSVGVSGDYSQTNDCAVLAGGASCTVSLNFVPTAAGTRNGALTVSSGASSSPDSVALNGVGTTTTFSWPNLKKPLRARTPGCAITPDAPPDWMLLLTLVGAAFGYAYRRTRKI